MSKPPRCYCSTCKACVSAYHFDEKLWCRECNAEVQTVSLPQPATKDWNPDVSHEAAQAARKG